MANPRVNIVKTIDPIIYHVDAIFYNNSLLGPTIICCQKHVICVYRLKNPFDDNTFRN